MATNKIYFNSTTTPITLNGIYWNGSKIEGCKGIKLNGDIVVSFETVNPQLNWSDYTNAYNAVWTSSDTTVETDKMARMTAENEFAICRSAWMLYTSEELTGPALGGKAQLFNFNNDGRLYIGDDAIVQSWTTLLQTSIESITIGSVHAKIPLYSMLTGLPLIYKREDASFAPTNILDINNDGGYDISYDHGKWAINFADLSKIKDQNNNMITPLDIVHAISSTLSVGVTYEEGSSHITIDGAENWGEFEFLDALSNVYVPGFGPFGENEADYPPGADDLYRLIPNEHFLAQPYWGINIDRQIRIKNLFDPSVHDCYLYILTGWGLQYIIESLGYTDGQDFIGDYYVQGEGNDEVNITYFDTSCFAGLQYPNILCRMNSSYSSFWPDYISTSGNWGGIYHTNDYGSQNPNSVFPTDCPYGFSSLLSDLNSVLPNAETEWIVVNNLQNAKVTCTLNQDVEADYEDGSDIITDGIAIDVFDKYQENYPTNFPYNNPSNPTEEIEYVLKLKMRTYPSYAISSVRTGATAENKWYLNAYDPYNVGGYYPVKKTAASVAGNMYKTTVNYTAQ